MGTLAKMKEIPGSSDEHFSADEITAAFSALSISDKLKLDRIEAIRRGGTRFLRGELLYEALCKALLGDRKCPRDVPLMAFLVQTMRSIASHDREQHQRFEPLDLDDNETLPAASIGGAAKAVALDQMRLSSSDTVDEIFNLFSGDEDAQLLVMAWADGCRGQELREATGLDQADLDYAAKRVRAKMRKLYPNGRMS